jgi:demethylmenaquinone methyltransferase/2-methoxy-6-polyprenyl-1,4-benzoquinol methylase
LRIKLQTMAGAENIKPYDSESAKKEQVAEMFNNISKRYDLLNHLLSLNIDRGWRRKVVSMVKADAPYFSARRSYRNGRSSYCSSKRHRCGYKQARTSVKECLTVGRGKVAKERPKQEKLFLELGDSENLPYADATFDAITVAFGVRNFQNLHNGFEGHDARTKARWPIGGA